MQEIQNERAETIAMPPLRSVKAIYCSCGVEFAPQNWESDVVKAWNSRTDGSVILN